MTHPLDQPQPPGGPQRQDRPDADVNPAPVEPGTPQDPGTPHDPDQPDVVGGRDPDQDAGHDAGPHSGADREDAPETPGTDEQVENAGTSLDEPSDDSGQ